jgi:hypothetical protein
MTWLTITGAGVTTATKFFGDAMNGISNLFNGVDVSVVTGAGPVEIHNNVIWTFNQANLKLFNPARTFLYKIQTAAIVADRQLNLPLLTGTDTVAVLALQQAFTNKTLSDSTVNFISAGDPAKILALSLTGITTGNTRTWTVPDSSGTIPLLGFAQTWTSAQTFTTGLLKLADIVDANGKVTLAFTATASAVDGLTIINAATANPATVQLNPTGTDTNIGLQFTPKGTGVVFGDRNVWSYPLTDETTLPTTGVKYTTEPFPFNITITDIIGGLTTAGTGATLFTFDILKEDSVNANTFTTIFTTKPTIDASEFTTTTAATPMALSSTTIEKGRRVQLKVNTLDSNSLARGAKLSILGYATAV